MKEKEFAASAASKERIGNKYLFGSIDPVDFYTMLARGQKTTKRYNHDQTIYAEVSIPKAADAISKMKSLRQALSGVNKGQQCICIQDLPKDCYTVKRLDGTVVVDYQ